MAALIWDIYLIDMNPEELQIYKASKKTLLSIDKLAQIIQAFRLEKGPFMIKGPYENGRLIGVTESIRTKISKNLRDSVTRL